MIIIDSNIWIFSENTTAQEFELSRNKIKETFKLGRFGINQIITSEVYHKLSIFTSREEAVARITHILEHPLAQWLDFSEPMMKNAINLAKTEYLRINDAIIAEQALQLNAKILTDNLKDFRKIRNLNIIPLR